MKNLKNKILVGICLTTIGLSSMFGLSGCKEPSSKQSDLGLYSIIKMSGNYVLHKNKTELLQPNGDHKVETMCGSYFSETKNGIFFYDNEGNLINRTSEASFAKEFEDIEKYNIGYTHVCEDCFPDGIENE